MTVVLKEDGVLYDFFKCRAFSDERNGRFFTDMDEGYLGIRKIDDLEKALKKKMCLEGATLIIEKREILNPAILDTSMMAKAGLLADRKEKPIDKTELD